VSALSCLGTGHATCQIPAKVLSIKILKPGKGREALGRLGLLPYIRGIGVPGCERDSEWRCIVSYIVFEVVSQIVVFYS
jgi:hypothetical protein